MFFQRLRSKACFFRSLFSPCRDGVLAGSLWRVRNGHQHRFSDRSRRQGRNPRLRNSEQIKTQLDQTLETFERVEMRMGILG